MNYDLETICRTYEKTVAQYDANIARCGRTWSPEYVAEKRREQQAVRDCITALRRPGITAEQALEAITRGCEAFEGSTIQ